MAPTYQVTAQNQTQTISPDGRIVDVMKITFITPGGTTASINVPLANYTPDYVNQLLSDYAARIETVQGL